MRYTSEYILYFLKECLNKPALLDEGIGAMRKFIKVLVNTNKFNKKLLGNRQGKMYTVIKKNITLAIKHPL